ncbi:hypothetical protein H310_11421 [Aphanomyces invadans]|uniref:FYVE-type domain-containing protein n=1 Tax=Aphanomyces invadans TaxID=157072 RepID=A0A024TLX0_9STRA|nr:hypothetical protein H310_11421 [Aphanomyces invadans]ETV95155.1 hypothetical protein H310_11421 [Aphanomyces invadans]|eukprot:XP_008876328.1 hypothetical protein H310_11421 [Aphanomyces invadans]
MDRTGKAITSKHRSVMYALGHLKSTREWVPDSARHHCSCCTKQFFLGGGKHHCRRCGDVVCKTCAPFAPALLPVVGRTTVRVCQSCRAIDAALPESHFLDDLSSSEDDDVEELLQEKSEMLLFNPSHDVMARIEMKLNKKKLVECCENNRPTSASSTASMAST